MRALVLSGGGSKGAFQEGGLRYLLLDQKRDYEIVCGVSVGALNAAVLSQAPLGDPAAAYAKVSSMWDRVATSNIRKFWFLWYVAALWKCSVYDSGPLQKWVQQELDTNAIAASGRLVRLGAVSWVTGNYFVATEKSPDFVSWVLASSSFPGFFKALKIDGEEWTDGGLRNVTPIGEAIRAGATEIDVIMTSNPDDRGNWDPKGKTTLWRLLRAIDLALDEVTRGDLKEAGLKNDLAKLTGEYKDVKIRLLQPSTHLAVDSLDFGPVGVRQMRAQGYADAVGQMS
jgi:NTE family protein